MEPGNIQTVTDGLRRENESMDDFEHLEAESTSPVKDNPNNGVSSKELKADNNKCASESLSFSPLVKNSGESQNSSDFSLLTDSKVDTPAEKISVFAMENVPDKLVGLAQSLDAGPNIFENFELRSDPKTTTQSFLESEISLEHPVPNVPLEIPHDDDLLKFQPSPISETAKTLEDIQNSLKSAVEKADEDIDSEMSKFLPSDEVMVFPPEDTKYTTADFGDLGDQVKLIPIEKLDEVPSEGSSLTKFKSDHEEEEEEYNLAASQDSSPIRMADKLEQYNVKSPPGSSPQVERLVLTESDVLTKSDGAIDDDTVPFESVVPAPSPKEDVPVEESLTPIPKSRTPVAVGPAFQLPLDSWFKPERLHPKVESLVYWRNPKISGAVLGAGLALLLSLSYCSLISVIAYVSLAALIGSGGFRLYRAVLAAVNKTGEGHPFRDLLDKDIAVSPDRAASVTQQIIPYVNAHVSELRRLFLVEDILDSIKFGVLLWALTYVGAIFNGLTLIILGFVSAFTLPRLYENNKQQIDKNIDLVRAKIAEITAKVQALNPLAGAAAKKSSEEKKEN